MPSEIVTRPVFDVEPVDGGVRLVINHTEEYFVDGVGPGSHVWAQTIVNSKCSRGDASRLANLEAKRRGYRK